MKHKFKRLLSSLLCVAIVMTMMPMIPQAEAVDTKAVQGNYITMPITIRDFAADGMLFEFNQVGATGMFTTGTSSEHTCYVDPSTWNVDGYGGLRVCTYGYTKWANTSTYWHCIICDRDGNIVKVIPSGTSKGTASSGTYVSNMQSGYYSIWAWIADDGVTDKTAYNTISPITDANKANYRFSLSGSTLTMTVGSSANSGTYQQGDTAGFSLLATGDADYINNLPANESTIIAGTDLIQNGTWGLKTDPDAVTARLTSGAPQQVYGAWIRTDLVTDTLDNNGKPVYTEATVDYLASYMQQIMAVPEQNADGSYNTYFVTGHKLPLLDNQDLAAKIRARVTEGLGTYNAAKTKFDNGGLRIYTDIKTWYDAAYFLLHNTWRDSSEFDNGSDGYGMPINAYKNLHLVETTNDDGETCYVFNSKFDDTRYDYAKGEIYNTQTNTYTIAKTNSGTETYVRGNPLPDARFDPLGTSGAGVNLGYGMSGDIYGDMISPSDADWAAYYDNTNYHLSLEGHAQFIYYEDANLYFTFTGDDDVYLYINGTRVLDVGAAHSISKVRINLNDVASLCGLRDGQPYDFDFYYMERHGTAANFGIETNIKIVDPAMTTSKTGYQNGSSTGYNGFVDPNKPVAYSFELQNNGESDLQQLTFDDEDIGIYLGWNDVVLNADSRINEMYLYRYNADGTVKSSYAAGSLTDETLKAELTSGLPVGEKIGIYGFKYQIPEKEWGNDAFTNTVYTTAISIGQNNSTHILNGMAEWKVQKATLVTEPFHVYDWVTKNVSQASSNSWYSPKEASVTLTKDELVQPVKNAGYTVPENVIIALCTASGSESSVNLNPNATLNADGSITYKSTKPGLDTVYYKIKDMNYDTMVFHYDVYTYGTVNNTYVLDYGLPVELNGEDFGFLVNDTLTLAQNPYTTTTVTVPANETEETLTHDTAGNPIYTWGTSNYGTFTWADPSLKYTPNDIIDGIDYVQANVQVLENGATELTKFTGVDMYETVTTVPASVVYYEENFPGITYVNEGQNQWAHYETVDDEGNSVAGTEQSADQNSNYGSDPNYEEDKVGKWNGVLSETDFRLDTSDLDDLQQAGIDALNNYLGLGGSDSNGTVNELVVKKTAEVMFFDFVGTGFEIISRTTDEEYAIISVMVDRIDTSTNTTTGETTTTYTRVGQMPVITESIGGDLYQVPIISIKNLPRAQYRVTIKAANNSGVTRILYVDGIRIYGPLSDEDALDYYNPEEYQAEFFEIKQLISEGKMIYGDASDTDDELQIVTGTTLIEDVAADGVLTSIDSVEDYMKVGPNNELYLDGSGATSVIVFFLTPDENIPEGARTIEIGAHRKSDSLWEDDGDVYMIYGGTAENIVEGSYSYDVASGTEMYYTIDVSNLTPDENGKYLVMIGTNGSENYGTNLALTNIKVAGYTISFAEAAIQTAADEGDLFGEPLVNETFKFLHSRKFVVEEAPEVEEIPVNENLTINSASLKAAKVVSGKVATLNVQASSEAVSIAVTDSEGNAVEAVRLTTKVDGEIVRFNFIWTVTGSRGDVLDYTVRVYDANGLASVNEESVSVTIK